MHLMRKWCRTCFVTRNREGSIPSKCSKASVSFERSCRSLWPTRHASARHHASLAQLVERFHGKEEVRRFDPGKRLSQVDQTIAASLDGVEEVRGCTE